MKYRKNQLITIGATAAATAAVTLFARNFVASEKKVTSRVTPKFAAQDPQFERCMSQLLGPPILSGNRVTPLHNGSEIFPAMLEAIELARQTITFETFIHWSGQIANPFADALSAKVRSGVKIHVLMDGIGCDCLQGEALRRMEDTGVELEVYHIANLGCVNHRPHRKLLVIDGKAGFTGGVGIADKWGRQRGFTRTLAGLTL